MVAEYVLRGLSCYLAAFAGVAGDRKLALAIYRLTWPMSATYHRSALRNATATSAPNRLLVAADIWRVECGILRIIILP